MSDIRALLLTDVVDSTKLSESLGDAAIAALWAAHDRVARDLLPRHRGREIDKTDGMLLLFDEAADAVAYAGEYHRALAGLPIPLKARAGLHVGAVILRENSADDIRRGAKPLEVDGISKPTAARVMALAQRRPDPAHRRGARALGATALAVQSHGHWAMKGVTEPIEIFEIGEPGAPFAAPLDGDKGYLVVRVGERWLPVKKIPNNLPQQVTSFIGRERELAEVKAMLGDDAAADAARHGRARQDAALAADRRRGDGRLPGRRLVPRPRADPGPGAGRGRGGARARACTRSPAGR